MKQLVNICYLQEWRSLGRREIAYGDSKSTMFAWYIHVQPIKVITCVRHTLLMNWITLGMGHTIWRWFGFLLHYKLIYCGIARPWTLLIQALSCRLFGTEQFRKCVYIRETLEKVDAAIFELPIRLSSFMPGNVKFAETTTAWCFSNHAKISQTFAELFMQTFCKYLENVVQLIWDSGMDK